MGNNRRNRNQISLAVPNMKRFDIIQCTKQLVKSHTNKTLKKLGISIVPKK